MPPVRPLSRLAPGWVRQVSLVALKDLRIEAASGEIVSTTCFFSILVAVLASLAFLGGEDPRRDVAPGVMWVSVSFSTILALSRTWQRERDEGAIRGLLTSPLSRSALFAGKALGLATFVAVVDLVVLLASGLFFQLELGDLGPVCLLLAAATPGIAAAGTLFGAMTIRTRARDLIVAVVMLPLLAPCVLTGVAGTRAFLGGTPMAELSDYFVLLALFDLLFIVGGLALFESVFDG